MSDSTERAIPLNTALVALLTDIQQTIAAATRERDVIVRTILASQNITGDHAYRLEDTTLLVSDVIPSAGDVA